MASCLARGGRWVGVRGLVMAGRLCEEVLSLPLPGLIFLVSTFLRSDG